MIRRNLSVLPQKIISGGQTGADTGALLAARELEIASGGTAPRGWLTEDGPRESRLRAFGLLECGKDGFPARTRRNVLDSNGTLLVGKYGTGGSRLTYDVARELAKPLFHISYPERRDRSEEFRHWLEENNVAVLNVAGNRESQSPGIAKFTRDFLVTVLGPTRTQADLP
jgi:Circularly permutated YpsA SLOG family